MRKNPLAKEMLLPLPVANARVISLENHLAPVAMRGGHGNPDVMSGLLKNVYLTCFVHEAVHGRVGLEPLRDPKSRSRAE